MEAEWTQWCCIVATVARQTQKMADWHKRMIWNPPPPSLPPAVLWLLSPARLRFKRLIDKWVIDFKALCRNWCVISSWCVFEWMEMSSCTSVCLMCVLYLCLCHKQAGKQSPWMRHRHWNSKERIAHIKSTYYHIARVELMFVLFKLLLHHQRLSRLFLYWHIPVWWITEIF